MDHPRPSPALSLPPEILSVILLLSGHSGRGPDSVQLGHVCRQWRQVLLGLSEYWANAVASSKFGNENDVPFLSLILDRSSSRTINLHAVRLCPSIATILAPNWHRVVILDVLILIEDHLRELHAILQDAASSSLQQLSVRVPQNVDDLTRIRLIPLPKGALPSLRRLHAPIFCLPFVVVPSVRQLRVLNSTSLAYPGVVEILSVLFNALALCTNLEKMTIGRLPITMLDIIPPHRVIYMYHLKSLDIYDSCIVRISAIFDTLRFPTTTVLKLGCIGDWNEFLVTSHVLPRVHPPANAVRMKVRSSRAFTLDLLEGDVACLTIRPKLYLEEIADILSKRPTVTMFECSFLSDPRSHQSHRRAISFPWNKLLPGFPNITRLSIRRHQPVVFARALAALVGAGPPCPRLEELAISWDASDVKRHLAHYIRSTVGQRARAVINAFVTCLTNRRQSGATPLRLLELHEHNPNISPPAEGVLDAGDAHAIEDALATVRALVNGLAVFEVMAGPITST